MLPDTIKPDQMKKKNFVLQISSVLLPEGLIEKHRRRKSNESGEVTQKKNSDNHFPFSCIVSNAFSHLSFDSIQGKKKTLLFHCHRKHYNMGEMRQTNQLFVLLRTKLFLSLVFAHEEVISCYLKSGNHFL